MKYKDQWKVDDSGYCVCAECWDKTNGDLLKKCSCNAFIDIDGEVKCKSCKNVWNCNLDLIYDACEKCGIET